MLRKYLLKFKSTYFLIGGFITIVIVQSITLLLFNHHNIKLVFFDVYQSLFEGQPLLLVVPAVVLFAPILETITFQVILIDYIYRPSIRYTDIIAVIISAVFFSLVHVVNSPFYPIMVLPGGAVLALTYLRFKDDFKGITYTAALHSTYNLLLFVFVMIK